jgi:hypothetical protein
MEYVSQRDITVASLSGRSVFFKKGVPTYAPDQMHAELIKHGVLPTEEIPEPEDDGSPKEPTVQTDRQAAIYAAFEKVILRGKRNDFSGTGAPHAAVLSKELGWSLDGKERDVAWQSYQNDKAPA